MGEDGVDMGGVRGELGNFLQVERSWLARFLAGNKGIYYIKTIYFPFPYYEPVNKLRCRLG